MIAATGTPAVLAPRTVQSARDALQTLAASSLHRQFMRAVLEASSAESELDGDAVVAGPLVALRDADTLARALGIADSASRQVRAGGVALELPTPVTELWHLAQSLADPERVALDALLRRATNPFEALATWPLEELFSAEESEQLRAMTSDGDATAQELRFVCVIAKFTRLCNLRCSYCHDWRSGPDQEMSFAVQSHLFRALLGDPSHAKVDVVWHGGEPTIIGRRGFLRVLALQRWFKRPRQAVANIVQTNATRIDAGWASLLARYRFRVGVSIDGPADLHNQSRPTVGQRPSFPRVQRGLRQLTAAGIAPQVLMVIGQAQLELGATAIVRFLAAEGVTAVGFIAVRPTAGERHDGEAYLERSQFARFLLEADAARREIDEPWLAIREVDAAVDALRGRQPRFCELQGNCVGRFFSIEPTGAVAHCDKFVGDASYTLGSVLVDDFETFRSGARVTALADDAAAALEPVRSCPHFELCQGWCPHEHYMADRYDESSAGDCCGLAELFDGLALRLG